MSGSGNGSGSGNANRSVPIAAVAASLVAAGTIVAVLSSRPTSKLNATPEVLAHVQRRTRLAAQRVTVRQGIAIPIVAELSSTRMNLGLGCNVHTSVMLAWTDPAWRASMQVDERTGTFPVQLWRHRVGMYERVGMVQVSAGPQPSFVQSALNASDWRAGDVLIIEWTPALMIGYAEDGRAITFPMLSVIEPGSNDPTAPLGVMIEFQSEQER